MDINGSIACSLKAKWDKTLIANYNGRAYTGKETAVEIEKIRLIIGKTGTRHTDNIAICGRNTAEWGIAFLASHISGSTSVTILSNYTKEGITKLIRHSKSRIALLDADIWSGMDPDEFDDLKCVISLQDFTVIWTSDQYRDIRQFDFSAEFDRRHPNRPDKSYIEYSSVDRHHISIINYTSGTTSEPKGVMISEEAIVSNIDYAIHKIPVRETDDIISMLPMAHMFGLMFEFLYPLCGGATVHFITRIPSPSYLLNAMKEIRPYLMITVPLLVEKIIQNGVLPIVSRPYMKLLLCVPVLGRHICNHIGRKVMEQLGGNVTQIIMGGAALNPTIESWCRKLALPYTVGYGMTESSPLISFESYDRYVPHSCGKAVDGMQVRIDSKDEENIPGEIEIKGTNVMSGYYRNTAETTKSFTEDGWFRTGDLGVIDRDGNIFIRGRSKNMILGSSGQNIYPEEIEAVINSNPSVIESIVVSRDTRLVALVVLDMEAMEEEGISRNDAVERIVSEANGKLPAYSHISSVEIHDKPFEKTPKMSIRRYLYA